MYFEGGIQKWSSLFELAQEAGFIIKPKVGWYQTVDMETGEVSEKSYRAKDLENNDEFFEEITKNARFKDFIEKKFKLSTIGGIMDKIDEDIDIDEDL